MKVVALAGGVGGAKLVNGLSRILPAGNLSVIVNTGDDFRYSGLYICPDLDTVTYTLANLNNPITGWGRKDETWKVNEEREAWGYPSWFHLGDKDLALHMERSRLIEEGYSLTEITRYISNNFHISQTILPMTNSIVRTMVNTKELGKLVFQEYFVKHKFQPQVTSIDLEGILSAHPTNEVETALASCDLVIICPSNPFVSIYPIISVPGMQFLLQNKPVIAVSPIIDGKAVKGPAAKMFSELGMTPSSYNVAKFYRGLIQGFILDNADETDVHLIDQWGIISMVTDTLMVDLDSQIRLAQRVINFGSTLAKGNQA